MLAQGPSFDTLKPCIALRRPGGTSSPLDNQFTTPRYTRPTEENALSDAELRSYASKLTGTPGYVTRDALSTSPTKVHPSKPHHVRGGSIGSIIDECKELDQIIPIQPCDSEMLVPLLHRHLEMKELIETNSAHFSRLRNAVGTRQFVKCLDLWTETTRAEKADVDWLKESQHLLRSHDNWALWCEVIGWDHHVPLIHQSSKENETLAPFEIPASIVSHSRKASGSSLVGTTIDEEPEYSCQ